MYIRRIDYRDDGGTELADWGRSTGRSWRHPRQLG
jgi:hypothetical protein